MARRAQLPYAFFAQVPSETRSSSVTFPMTFDTWQFHQASSCSARSAVGLPGKISQFHSAGFEGSVA
jgi:hypothetical protein